MTLITVAAIESLITNRENERCWLNAILFAMKPEMFKPLILVAKNSRFCAIIDFYV